MANNVLTDINEELQVLQKELSTFKSAVSYLETAKSGMKAAGDAVKAAEDYHRSKLKDLDKTYVGLQQLISNVHALEEKIGAVNFPERLDGIERTLTTSVSEARRFEKNSATALANATKAIAELKADVTGLSEKLNESIVRVEKQVLNLGTDLDKKVSATSNTISTVSDRVNALRQELDAHAAKAKVNAWITFGGLGVIAVLLIILITK